MINRIIALIDLESNFENILPPILQLFGSNQDEGKGLSVEIFHHIQGPADWEFLTRSARSNYPKCKQELALARERMDEILRRIREKGIKANKQILISENDGGNTELKLVQSDLVLVQRDMLKKGIEDHSWVSTFIQESPLLILPDQGGIRIELNDIVLSSTFEHGLEKGTMELLFQFNKRFDFHIDFLFINTKTKFESTKVSIEKIKASIRESCLGKTHISVFNAECFAKGLNEFQSLKNCDLIVVEKYDLETVFDGNECGTPILFIP